ncbi:MAG: transporter substrate-binding domain-containing protein [Candidatus Azobacteroides sp.]|nr:transporter substrate-binding domain-containing protein [Candidatus Azobacteroides sp.]
MKSVRDLPEIVKDKTLNVVTEYNSIDFHVAGDTITGSQYELCQFISHRSGLTVQLYLENDLETAIRKLENNVYDVIAQNIAITNENRKFLAFTVPITYDKQVLVQRKHNNTDSVPFITNQLNLAEQTVYVTKNSPAVLRLKHLADEIAEPIYIKEITGYTSEQLIYMVANKEIDYAVVDKEISLKNIPLYPDLDFGTDIGFTQLQAWGLRKNSPLLLDSLNVWITMFQQQVSVNSRSKK